MRYILIFWFLVSTAQLSAKELTFKFYSDTIRMTYDEALRDHYHRWVFLNDELFRGFYDGMNKTPYQGVLTQLDSLRERYALTDIFYYRLLWAFTEALLKDQPQNHKIIFCSFMLIKAGYGVLVVHERKDKWHLAVEIDKNRTHNQGLYLPKNVSDTIKAEHDLLEHHSRIKKKKKKYFTLDCSFYCSSEVERKKFIFDMSRLPKFVSAPELLKKQIFFSDRGMRDTMEVVINKTHIDVYADLPNFAIPDYFKVDPSPKCVESLVPFLKRRTKHLGRDGAVSYLLSFVSTGFTYVEDKKNFGYDERRMTAEEALYYGGLDCEDAAALFFYLVKEVVGADMLVLLYPGHVNIAVLLDKSYGLPFLYKGKKYSVCEPTANGTESVIGDSQIFEENPNPEVAYEYQAKKK